MNVLMKLFVPLAVVFACGAVHAQDVHGVLRVVKGDVKIKQAKTGQTVRARLGMQVYPSDVILTGKEARVKVVMIDNNEINVSPDSQIEIKHYEYNPAQNKKDVLLNVIYGKVRSKVEQHYDGKTTKFEVKTPSAVAGVRGTDFITSYNRVTNASQVITFRGAVEFGTPGAGGVIANAVRVTPGKMSTSVAGNAPSAPTVLPKDQLAKVDQESKSEAPPAAGERAPSSDHEKGGKDHDQGQKPGTGPNASNDDGGGSPKREPASAGGPGLPPPDTDVVSGPGPLTPPPPLTVPPPVNPLPTCSTCTGLLQGTKTHVTVHLSN